MHTIIWVWCNEKQLSRVCQIAIMHWPSYHSFLGTFSMQYAVTLTIAAEKLSQQ